MSNMWMVRAGEGAYAIQDFRSKGVVAIGWVEGDADWTQFANRDAIQAKLAEAYPDNTEGQNFSGANKIERFLREFSVGDRVITYDPSRRHYLVGTITGKAEHRREEIEGLETIRKVSWRATSFLSPRAIRLVQFLRCFGCPKRLRPKSRQSSLGRW